MFALTHMSFIFLSAMFLRTTILSMANNSHFKSIEKEANDFFKRFWEWRLLNNVELATIMGVQKYNDRLMEMSLRSYKRREGELQVFLGELKYISKLAKQVVYPLLHLNIKVLRDDIEGYLSGVKFMPYLWPLNNMEGPQINFPRLIGEMSTESVNDVSNIIQRMRLFRQQITETIALLNEGIRLGIVMNKVSFEKAGNVFNKMAETDFSESLFFKPFTMRSENISPSEWVELIKTAKSVFDQYVRPSYKELSDFILGKYLKNSRAHIGVSTLPRGKEYYASCLRFHTTTNLTASEIHEIGLEEVARIASRMELIRENVGYMGNLSEFRNFLRTNTKFGFKNENEIIKRYKGLKKKVTGTLKKVFQRLPKLTYVIKPVPKEVAPTYPIGFYQNVSPDGKEPGIFYANTYKPATRRKYVSLSLFLHEAVPGHHLQTSLTYEYGSSLSFRKFLGVGGLYSQVPAQFAMNSAYLEGWGLYAEYLGEELGLYTDIYDLFGRLSGEMLRACRLVIDTGIHLYGWSRAHSIDYLKENTAEDDLDIISEIDRYITWPGQACAYKVGEMKIKELRARTQKYLGNKFNVRKFHDFIVTIGAVPLRVLEEQVDQFIKKQRHG